MPGFYTQHLKFEEWRSSAWDLLTHNSGEMFVKSLIHGNFSADDVMMDKKENLVFTSMSRNYVGSPSVDVATFLFSSCDNDLREENLMKLLEIYCFSFSENLKRMEVDQNTLTTKILNEEFER